MLCQGFQGVNTVNCRKVAHIISAQDMAQHKYNRATWFTDETLHEGRWIKCVRAAGIQACTRMTTRMGGDGVSGECEQCAAIQHERTYTKALYRAATARHGAHEKPKGEKVKMWMMKRKNERLVAQLTGMKVTLRKVDSTQYLTAASLRGDLRVVARRLDNMARQGLLVGRDGNALEFVRNIINNLSNTGGVRGNRHNDVTKALMGLLRKLGGAKAYGLMSNMTGVPCDSTVRTFMKSEPFNAQLCDADFERIAEVYRGLMRRLGLKEGSVLCMVAEDETAVNPLAQYDKAQDAVIGYCGWDCGKKCKSVISCRKGGCEDTHSCEWEGSFTVSMEGDFDKVWKEMKAARVGSLARIMVINPLHPGLPKLVCLWTATCKAFTASEYVAKQWQRVAELFQRWIEPVVGRLVGHSSDGDSTRRKCMVSSSYIEAPGAGEPMLSGLAGFVFTCARDAKKRPVLRCDQCFLHNGKKMLNNTASSRRKLQLGPHHTLNLVMLDLFLEDVHLQEHGVKRTDTNRDGFRAMDVLSLVRLLSVKARRALQTWIEKEGRPEPGFKGINIWLGVVWEYMDIFMSETCSLERRVEGAAFVVTFLVMWHDWAEWYVETQKHVAGTPPKLDDVFISREAYTDVVMSCHFVVMLIMVSRDEAPDRPIPFRRLGSDCAEDWFSLLGGFVDNKRTYTVCEALQTIRTMLRAWEITGTHGLHHKGRRPVGEVPWEELDERRGCQTDWPKDPEIKAAWKKGVRRAKRVWEDDLDGKPYARARGAPEWWKNPTFKLGVSGLERLESLFRSESDMLVENEGRDGGAGVGGVGDGAECEGVGAGVGRVGDEGDRDRVTEDEISEARDEAMDIAVVVDVCHEMLAGVNEWMEVPDRGKVHKRTICSWAGSASENLSGHLGMRAAQAGSRSCVDVVVQENMFNIQADAWIVELGSDIAVVFDEDVQIGSIFMMRRKYDNGGFSQYKYPVDLHVVRKGNWNLQFVCCWYEKQPDNTYLYGVLDTAAYELKNVACPVTLQISRW